MSHHDWSPEVARAMHEMSSAAPTAPAFDELAFHRLSPPRRPRVGASIAAAVLVVGVIAGLVALSHRDERSNGTVSGPMEVVHSRYEVSITATLTCADQISTDGKFTNAVIDSYSDRSGKRWRSTTTFPDGSTYDSISTGSALYPTGMWQRGIDRDDSVGCVGPNAEPVLMSKLPYSAGFYTLSVLQEIQPDERPFVLSLDEVGYQRIPGEHVDSQGRPSVLRELTINGSSVIGNAPEIPMLQVTDAWVDPADATAMTERRFANTIDGLGSTTLTETLIFTETVVAPTDLFETTGYRSIPTSPRPAPPSNPEFGPVPTTPLISAPTESTGAAPPSASALTARFEFSASEVVGGATLDGFLIVTNSSTELIESMDQGCAPKFGVYLTSSTVAGSIAFRMDCLTQPMTFPPGETRLPVTVAAGYPACAQGASNNPQVPVCPPTGLAPLPPGNYLATFGGSIPGMLAPTPVAMQVTEPTPVS